MIWVGIGAGVVLIGSIAYFWYEMHIAPELDNDGYIISDPHGTLGPKFKKGEPVPPEHYGKRYD
jgi:hypothetical protein